MPAIARARRAPVVLSVLVVLAQSVVGAIGDASAAASTQPAPRFPRTVAREVPVAVGRLVAPGMAGRAAASADGMLQVARAVRTARHEVCPGMWFTAVTITWRRHQGTGAVEGLISTERASGFGRTRLMASEPEEGPDPGAVDYHPHVQATEILWTGGGRCIRFALRIPGGSVLSNFKAAFVNTSGTAAGPGTAPRATDRTPAAPAFEPGVSSASAARPHIVSRAQWGASPRYFDTGTPGCRAPYYAPEVKVAYVHHTAGSNSYSPSSADDVVRAVYWFHTQARGYCDIAYSFLISRYGQIFEGRAGGVDRPVIPGSQSGFNTYTTSASLMGNFDTTAVTRAALSALERLLAWRLDVAHVPAQGHDTLVSQGGETDRFAIGAHIRLPTIVGHRETSFTSCPGGHLWRLLPSIRRAVGRMGQPKILGPHQSREQIRAGRDEVRMKAKATDPLAWTVSIRNRGGELVRTLHGQGRRLSVSWGGKDQQGHLVPPGKYEAMVKGRDSRGHAARPALLPVEVVARGVVPKAPLGPGDATPEVPRSGFRTLHGVAAVSPKQAWAVGGAQTPHGGHTLVERFLGGRWHAVRSPSPGSSGYLNDVDAATPSQAWAVGFSCTERRDCAAGGFGSRALVERWDGSRWTVVRVPQPGTGVDTLTAVEAVGPADVWAVGNQYDEGTYRRAPLLLHWNGHKWSVVPGPRMKGVDVALSNVTADGPSDVWAVGHRCTGACAPVIRSVPVVLHWNGARWSLARGPNIHAWDSSFEDAVPVSPTSVWAVGSVQRNRLGKSHPLLEHWNGTAWRRTKASSPGGSGDLFAAARIPPSSLWAVGDFGASSRFRTLVKRHSASGWRTVSSPSPSGHASFLSDVDVLSGRSAWAVGPSARGTLILHWNGKRWATVRSP